MCGIVGAIAERDVVPILLEGLRRLEYRGYDSAGVAVVEGDVQHCIGRVRAAGKVADLVRSMQGRPLHGRLGIAHTRWATHGVPSEANAHPHICDDSVAVVHNGIIENYQVLGSQQKTEGFRFTSETDTEVIAHQVTHYQKLGQDLLTAVQSTVADLDGAYALGVMTNREPGRLVAARRGSPLVIGVGIGEHFIASDVAALLPVTRNFIFLEEGDVADLRRDYLAIYDEHGQPVERPVKTSELAADAAERGQYRHYMLKEIFEQPTAIAETLEGRIADGRILEAAFGPGAGEILDRVKAVQVIACGTSYHAGLIGKYWFEGLAGIPCNVEVASEFRYRRQIPNPDALVVTISQLGETADTLAALKATRRMGFGPSLTICNVPESSLVRESDLALMTRAGPEIGVASTKAFTTQLVALMLLVIALGKRHQIDAAAEAELVGQLSRLPGLVEQVLALDDGIQILSELFVDKQHALFLGRGWHYPVAMEGALKLKEISYIHAEAYAAGELKHGPLALVDSEMPVIAVAPNDALLEKLRSNLQEVSARGGQLYVFADEEAGFKSTAALHVMEMPTVPDAISPILYTVPLQLLSYHVAVQKGTDVDQPRNLAKSVTVE